jgi:predicted MFS family arabinose efflux permease
MVRVSDPLLPQIAADIGTSIVAASVIASAYAVAHGTTQAVAGPLGDRWPKYPTVAVLCALSALATFACGLSHSLTGLAIARLACGVTAGMIMPLGMAMIGNVVPYERRQPMLGRFLSGQISGLVFGQIAGGLLGDLLGWRAVFVCLAGLFVLASGALAGEAVANPRLRIAARDGGTALGLIAHYRLVWAEIWARIIIASLFIEGALMFGAFAYIGADLHVRLGHAREQAGMS